VSARSQSPLPGRLGPWQYVQNVLFYIHIATATFCYGFFGMPWVIARGRNGANAVGTNWLRHLMWAAKVHLGLTCEVRGTPPTEDCIVAAKHQCFYDIIAIAHAVPRRAFIMKREVMRVPVMGWYAWKVGSIPIDRAKGRDAMKSISSEISARMAGDGLGQLIIYPEGTRTEPGERRSYKHGVASIRNSTGLPIAPVAVNTGLFWPRKGWGIRPGRAVIEFLPIIPPEASSEGFLDHLEAQIEGNSDRLMAEAGFAPCP
jgi:1-acyl-sn-glycerol-3-phosphate acyltransferase